MMVRTSENSYIRIVELEPLRDNVGKIFLKIV